MNDEDILRDLRCPFMSGATDAELAADHETTVEHVRRLRAELRRNYITTEVALAASEAAETLGWEGRPDELVLRALEALLTVNKR